LTSPGCARPGTLRDIAPDKHTPIAPLAVTDGDCIADRYRLVRRLARGGMAEVWEAVDDVLARPVAVKILLPHLADDEAFVARFRREAIAAARLSDPHIVSIYDTCSRDGVEAIVMELVRGSTLRQLLDHEGALDARRATDIAVQVARALDHAHRNGLVHRDVKPGNILLSEDGRVLVTDFGIAKAASEGADLTEVGQVVGTAKYLSPEQVRGESVDARSDVYALGVVLYEMLGGRPPFTGDNSTATAVARLTSDAVPLHQLRHDVPPELEEAVCTAMELEPADRQQSAAELARVLGRALHGAGLTTGTDHTAGLVRPTLAPAGRGPVVEPDPTPVPGGVDPDDERFVRSERRWLVPAFLILVVAVTLGILGIVLNDLEAGRDVLEASGDPPTAVTEPPPELAVVGASAFDPPPGDGREHDRDLPNLLDGDPATTWRTERYNDRVLAGGAFKPGVGVVLRLDGQHAVRELVVDSPTNDWSAEVYVGDGTATDIGGWGEPVAAATGIGAGQHLFPLDGAEGSAVLLWITDLGDGGLRPRYSTAIGSVTVRG
jgi:eukaryotic-like serine/threonine-protein kinase